MGVLSEMYDELYPADIEKTAEAETEDFQVEFEDDLEKIAVLEEQGLVDESTDAEDLLLLLDLILLRLAFQAQFFLKHIL